ncbi:MULTISPECIES: Bug family tripartite tricarboxylate transporter substrate binding protein [Achromobacter]|uniref:Tripartite tricarboxylate transporter substrate binding protein n=1 Tax=Achromobacter spanius TaxID=217203 RepID=A0ABY8GRH1_9BURK|nr:MULTISPECIES: tripartite tricarboxylate transporter substrate binding protein [Achromobacter]WAI83459.1 tripartite tricarboxylate transporter substrate binding protein [Achromobacter spanius]WEX93543.1 tripartite tricarboxylate transporter substrate binding protein [Achromobacter sp. SS2-2022]WFP07297.1 tripartite tricarboxylate transporter substrate binding protein [Achromobacter spanius]
MLKLGPIGKRLACRVAAGLLAAGLALPAMAEYPDRPIQFVSPYAAGGANDYLTRLMARYMGEQMKANIVVDNKSGANGMIGAAAVAKSDADGYTLLMGNSATHGTNPTLYKKQPYDANKDFTPVAMVASVPIVMVVNAGLGVNNVEELLQYGKKHRLSFGSSGIGGTGHLTGEAFKAATGLDMVHVPYKGDSPAVTDAMGGQVDLAFVGTASATTQQASGRIKILAVAHPNRTRSLPNVPTMAEAGFPGLEFSQWYALFAPAGTPAAIVEKLNAANKAALANPEVQKSLDAQSAEGTYRTPAELGKFYQSEIQRFGDWIKKLNLSAQ